MSSIRVGERMAPSAVSPEHASRVPGAADGAEERKNERTKEAAPPAFAEMVSRLAAEANHHEQTIRAITKGGGAKLEAADLLALQSDVYRYGQVVELTSKLAEQGTQSVQTVLKSGGQ